MLRKYGKSKIAQLKRSLDKSWSLAVRTRDRFTCQKCGKQHKQTHAAHIFSRNNLATRFNVENGVTLCYYCHIIWSHREPLEFAKWIEEKLGEKKFKALEAKSKTTFSAIDLPRQFDEIMGSLDIAKYKQ